DLADVEVAVGPAVEPSADARAEGVVDGRMAQSAGDADGLHLPALLEEALDADDGVELEERDRGRRIIHVHFVLLDLRDQLVGKRLAVDLEADRQRDLRADGRLDRAVEVERVAPEGLISERVAPERLAALREH